MPSRRPARFPARLPRRRPPPPVAPHASRKSAAGTATQPRDNQATVARRTAGPLHGAARRRAAPNQTRTQMPSATVAQTAGASIRANDS